MPERQPSPPPTPPMKPFRGILSWEQVKETVETQSLHRFSRTPEVTEAYLHHLQTNVKRFASISDCVKVQTLHLPSFIKDELIHAVPVDQASGWKVKPWTLTKNRFPYAVEKGVEHWVLWSIGEKALDNLQIQSICDREFLGLEYTFLVNPPRLKSVPEIHHVHIFFHETMNF
ncbi:hypothetical protein BC830DRAFT_283433 [Chytriomyces sp. MP71]|nr:hypothetical protein BC830DRAFT_283433 [Chytriomyces sp. MP71]